MSNSCFEIPIVLFLFKRIDKPLLVMEKVSQVKPKKIYLLSDGGRTEEENKQVELCRQTIEESIFWDCEIVKRYADKNIGVYDNIAEGAKWVFEHEKFAIFLEDDNLPELSFFDFCKEILYKYENDSRVFWICGTNYLEKYEPNDGSSYLFTKNMMPCGWASWANKFINYYNADLEFLNNKDIRKKIESEYISRKLFFQDIHNLDYEIEHFYKHKKFYSWDYQMSFSIRANGLLGIVPKFNQISNIGVDDSSIHGGNDPENLMTERFCHLKTYPLSFPIIHPKNIQLNNDFEEKISNIIIDPSFFSIRSKVSRFVRKVFKIDKTTPLRTYFSRQFLKR